MILVLSNEPAVSQPLTHYRYHDLPWTGANMMKKSVAPIIDQAQQDPLWTFELVRFKGDQVFCPMCEDWHLNNTNCQRND